MPSPRKCLVASTRPAPQTAAGRVYSSTPKSPSVAHLSHLSPSQLQLCNLAVVVVPSDAALFQPQLSAACPLFSIILCRRWLRLSHAKTMADASDPTGLLAAVEQLVWSTYMVAREFPFTILPLILIAFVSLVILAVSLNAPSTQVAWQHRQNRSDRAHCLRTTEGHVGTHPTRGLPKAGCLPHMPRWSRGTIAGIHRPRNHSVLIMPLSVSHRPPYYRTQATRSITLREDIHHHHSRWYHFSASIMLVRPMGRRAQA